MSEKKTGLAIPEPIFIQKLETMDDMLKFGKTFISSGFAPKHFENPESVMVAIMYGTSIGLKVAASLQQVVVVNGLPTLKGDAAKALILSSGICTEWRESSTGTLDAGDLVYTITAKRSDGQEMTSSFSVFQAKRAGLWISDDDVKKDYKKSYGPWYKYPDRMIRYRALGFLARDLFPDVLQGMVTEEEAKDYVPFEDMRVITPSVAENVEDTGGLKGGDMHISEHGGHKGKSHVGEATKKLTKVPKLPELKKMTTATKMEKCASAEEIYSNLSKDEMANLMMDLNIPFTTQTKADEMAIALWNYKCDQEAMNEGVVEEKVTVPVASIQPAKEQVVLQSQVNQEDIKKEEQIEVVETAPSTTSTVRPPRPGGKEEVGEKQPEPSPVAKDGKSLVKAEIKALVDKLPASVNSSREMNDIQGVWELVSGNWEEPEQLAAIAASGLQGDLEEVLNSCTSEQINAFVEKL